MSQPFRNRFNGPRLTPEQAQRQGVASRRAFELLGNREDAISFLNTHDDALGGRPLDLAVADADGLSAVEAALAKRAGG